MREEGREREKERERERGREGGRERAGGGGGGRREGERERERGGGGVFLTSQQHASISQGRICEDNCTCCHIETEVADPTWFLTQPHYADAELTSSSTYHITPGA